MPYLHSSSSRANLIKHQPCQLLEGFCWRDTEVKKQVAGGDWCNFGGIHGGPSPGMDVEVKRPRSGSPLVLWLVLGLPVPGAQVSLCSQSGAALLGLASEPTRKKPCTPCESWNLGCPSVPQESVFEWPKSPLAPALLCTSGSGSCSMSSQCQD